MYEVEKYVDLRMFQQCVEILGGKRKSIPLLSSYCYGKPMIVLKYLDVMKWIEDPSELTKIQFRALALAAASAGYQNDSLILNVVKSINKQFDVFLESALTMMSYDMEVIRVAEDSLFFQERDSIFEYLFAASVVDFSGEINQVKAGVLARRIDELLRPSSISVYDSVVYAVVASMAARGLQSGLANLLLRAFKNIPKRKSKLASEFTYYEFLYQDVCQAVYNGMGAAIELNVMQDSEKKKHIVLSALLQVILCKKEDWSIDEREFVKRTINANLQFAEEIVNENNRNYVIGNEWYPTKLFFDRDGGIVNKDILRYVDIQQLSEVVRKSSVEEFEKLYSVRPDIIRLVKCDYYTKRIYDYCVSTGILVEDDERFINKKNEEPTGLTEEFLRLNNLGNVKEIVVDYLDAKLTKECLIKCEADNLSEILEECSKGKYEYSDSSMPSFVLKSILMHPDFFLGIKHFYQDLCASSGLTYFDNFNELSDTILTPNFEQNNLSLLELKRAKAIGILNWNDFDKFLLWESDDKRTYALQFAKFEKYELFCAFFSKYGIDTSKKVNKSVAVYCGLPKYFDSVPDYVLGVGIFLKMKKHPLMKAFSEYKGWETVSSSSNIFNKDILQKVSRFPASKELFHMLQASSMPIGCIDSVTDVKQLGQLESCVEARSISYNCEFTDIQTACMVSYGQNIIEQTATIKHHIIAENYIKICELCSRSAKLNRLLTFSYIPYTDCDGLMDVLHELLDKSFVADRGTFLEEYDQMLEEWRQLATVGVEDVLIAGYGETFDFTPLNRNKIKTTGFSVITEVNGTLSIITECPEDVLEFAKKWKLPVYVKGMYPCVVHNYKSKLGVSLNWLTDNSTDDEIILDLLEVCA
ncbi:hypothetical protein AALB53_13960 [Lachnospiraceae bacterium 47-T17]